ncbi:MAG: Uma2 family endonuclease [Gemmatales bacterium]
MSSAPTLRVSPDQYLVQERKASYKSEYYQGEIFAMAGASKEHVRISTNLISESHQQLKGKMCEVFGSDLRLKIERTGLMTYPDAIIVCGDAQYLDGEFDTLLNPVVLFEVLSHSTEKYDRGAKAAQYRQIPSLREYVLIAQDHVRVEQYHRQPDDRWLLTEYTNMTETLQLASVALTISLADLYRQVRFASER